MEERINIMGLRPDRADVIIPATRIYLNAMKWSGARQIYVPKIGLSDGINVEILEGIKEGDEIKVWNKASEENNDDDEEDRD